MTSVDNPTVRRVGDWDAEQLESVADSIGTPVYVIDVTRVRENFERMRAAFPAAGIHYAVKANTSPPVVRALAELGAGMECVSAGEVTRVMGAGVNASEILYTAVNPPGRDLDSVTDIAGLTITVGSRDTLDRLLERGFAGRVCIRVNPGVGAGHHEHVATGGNPKFGVPYGEAEEVMEYASEQGCEVVGVHAHAGSGILGDDIEAHTELVTRLASIVRSSALDLEFVDVGGGFGVPYRPEDPPLNLSLVADSTREALGDISAELVIEPGRYFVADAGVLLTRVNTVKETPETVVAGVDAGMNTLIRPALYDAYHPIRTIAAGAAERDEQGVTVAGPICESADVFCTDRQLPSPVQGDLLAIGNAGAYGWEMSSQYNSHPRVPIVGLDTEGAFVVRERETLADLTRGEVEVDEYDSL